MNAEYLIVGIGKGSKTDFEDLYQLMKAKVYAVALSTVRDKSLAREIAAETFRRVRIFAYTFDTNYDGEFWILDMARKLSLNAMKDKQVAVPDASDATVDNASALVLKSITQLKNERGLILALRSLTDLSFKDIGDLSGYYTGSARKEAQRGLAELRAAFPDTTKKELLKQLKDDFQTSCPDFLEYIQLDRPTKVAHVSHEAMFLEGETADFQSDTEQSRIAERSQLQKAKRNRRLKIGLSVCAILIILSLGTALIVKLARDSKSASKPERAQTSAGIELVQLGDTLYYRDASKGIFAYKNGEITTLYDEPVRDLIAGGQYLFFRNYKNGQIYRLTPETKECVQVTTRAGTTLAYYDGYVYYSNTEGIYRFSAQEDVPEFEAVYTPEVEDAPIRYQMAFTDQGDLIFSAGADKGIYRVDDGNLYTLYGDEAYYFQIEGNLLFLDTIGLSNKRQLQALSLTGKEEDAFFPTISLYSSAYYVVGNTVYYEGTGKDNTQNGLYQMDLTDGSTTLIQTIDEDDLHITHIYATEDTLYCYYSDGRSDGESKLTLRSMAKLDKEEQIFYHSPVKK
ncbi:MAG: DUF5050 domain-containing protein [Clostridia bacterium]|nr:DUF5050 domain-containing protein [Clostridia bacterium]